MALNPALILLIAFTTWLCLRTVFRIYLHPLRKIPGPRLAPITSNYGAYYDLFGSTSYTRHILELHDKYGPVVRIFPDWVHIADMRTYDEVFKNNTTFQPPGCSTLQDYIPRRQPFLLTRKRSSTETTKHVLTIFLANVCSSTRVHARKALAQVL